jgi:multisubunit Na+/H+ antiporter MnhE subunit
MRRASSVLVSWAALAGFWLLIVGTAPRLELAAALAAASIGVGSVAAVRLLDRRRFRVEPRALAPGLRALGAIVPDFGRLSLDVGRALVQRRRLSGQYVATRFPAMRADAAVGGRRALAEALGSIAPGTIVVDVDRERGEMLVHRLGGSVDRRR